MYSSILAGWIHYVATLLAGVFNVSTLGVKSQLFRCFVDEVFNKTMLYGEKDWQSALQVESVVI